MPAIDIPLLEEALKRITFPELGDQNLIQTGIVTALTCDEDGAVLCILEVPPLGHHAFSQAQKAAEQVLRGVSGVRQATVVMTGSAPSKPSPPPPLASAKPLKDKLPLPHIRHIIAVASGKGGVGKSTVATNLAVGLAQRGHSVGLLDADIHGPSLPMMMGLSGKPESVDGKTLVPPMAHGVKCMSMGLMAPSTETPLAWRGPMIQSAVFQMLKDVQWGDAEAPLTYLIMDLPPGTGDVMLTTCQSAPLTGAIIVSTPQDLAFLDARRAHRLFHQLDVPLLGLVENMSLFTCPHCAGTSPIFGQGGADHEATTYGIPLLGHLPLDMSLRQAGDAGTPALALGDAAPASVRASFEAIITALETIVHTKASAA